MSNARTATAPKYPSNYPTATAYAAAAAAWRLGDPPPWSREFRARPAPVQEAPSAQLSLFGGSK